MPRGQVSLPILGLLLFWLAPARAAERVLVQPATHPALVEAALPALIPAETFFSTERETWSHRIPPDGRKLLWIALHEDRPTIHFRDIDGAEAKAIPAARAVRWAYWAFDSRHITAWWDEDGDENYHFLVADTAHPDRPVRDATPRPGVKMRFQQYFPDRPLARRVADRLW